MKTKKNSYIVDFGEGQHLVGRFRINKEYYVILVNIENGNRWQEPTSISEKDMTLLNQGLQKHIKRIVSASLSQDSHSTSPIKMKIGF